MPGRYLKHNLQDDTLISIMGFRVSVGEIYAGVEH